MDKETETEILGLFNACPQTGWGMIGEGEYDVLWRIDARNERDVELAMSTMTERFGTRILEKSLTITTLHAYLPWNKALGGERKVVHPGKKYDLAEKIDNFDWAILRILYDNSRSTTVEIAKKIGLSPDAVQVRVRNLIKKGIILGFSAYLDARKLGFDYYKILISFRDISTADEEKFVQFCIQNDDIVFLNKTLGSWDIELDIITRNNLELHSFMCALKEKFGNFISKHKYMSAIDERMPNPLR
jgi:Lrp/AsnC family leucine-responsive transcriptional regulator